MSQFGGSNLSEHEIEIRERIVRVEESLERQLALMKQGFEQVDRRFEELREDTNKRFEELREDTNKRFEQVDKHFSRVYGFFISLFVVIIGGFVIQILLGA